MSLFIVSIIYALYSFMEYLCLAITSILFTISLAKTTTYFRVLVLHWLTQVIVLAICIAFDPNEIVSLGLVIAAFIHALWVTVEYPKREKALQKTGGENSTRRA